jgi:hypothetical protein
MGDFKFLPYSYRPVKKGDKNKEKITDVGSFFLVL